MEKIIILNPDHVFELRLALRLGIDLFPGIDQSDGSKYYFTNDKRKKIVIKHWWPYLEHGHLEKQDLSWADLVVCYTTEVVNGPWSHYEKITTEQFNNPNFITVCNGTYQLVDYPTDRVYEDTLTFFSQTAYYCYFEPWMQTKNKPMIFDALLGQDRPHRVFLMKKLIGSGLIDKTFASIYGSYSYRSPELYNIESQSINQYFQLDRIEAQDHMPGMTNGRNLGESIPIDVYRNSWYSLVAETLGHRSTFLTEKTAKPILLKRLFVLFGSQGSLSKLHRVGFKTFHDVIDESYDLEEDPIKRWSMAFEQVIKLSLLDHYSVYKKIQPILEHNYQRILDIKSNFLSLADFIKSHIKHV